jgi:hypothetical protein
LKELCIFGILQSTHAGSETEASSTQSLYGLPMRPSFSQLSKLIHFENIETYEIYEKSIELAAFRDHMSLTFEGSLDSNGMSSIN